MTRRVKGEGSISREGDAWRVQVVIDGKRHRRRAPTKSAALDILRDLQEHHKHGVAPSKMTVGEWVEHWITHIAVLSLDTEKGYRRYLKSYIMPALGHIPLKDLSAESIERLYTSMKDGTYRKARKLKNGNISEPKPLSSSTIHQTHAILGRAMKVALQRKHITWNPVDAVAPPKTTKHKVESMSRDDARAVLAAAKGTTYEARWSIALALGLRPAEALGLTWEALAGNRLTVKRQLTYSTQGLVLVDYVKSDAAYRTITVPKPIMTMLQKWRATQLEWMTDASWTHWESPGRAETPLMMFTMPDGTPLKPRHDATLWYRLLDAAGVPRTRRYVARHTAASTLLDMGVPLSVVSEILGHTDESFTRRQYVDIFDERLDEAAEALNSLWG